MQTSVELRSNFFPRDGSDLTGIDLPDATLDLFRPGGFDAVVRFTMQRFEETAGKFCPIRLRQFRCFSQELCYVARHERIVPRRGVRSVCPTDLTDME